jgi:hypothetical protein
LVPPSIVAWKPESSLLEQPKKIPRAVETATKAIAWTRMRRLHRNPRTYVHARM